MRNFFRLAIFIFVCERSPTRIQEIEKKILVKVILTKKVKNRSWSPKLMISSRHLKCCLGFLIQASSPGQTAPKTLRRTYREAICNELKYQVGPSHPCFPHVSLSNLRAKRSCLQIGPHRLCNYVCELVTMSI